MHWGRKAWLQQQFNNAMELWYYTDLVKADFPKPPILIIYKLFPESQRRIDTANVIDVVNKLFCDAITPPEHIIGKNGNPRTKFGLNLIPDDSSKYVVRRDDAEVIVDPKNPRVEITIEHLEEKHTMELEDHVNKIRILSKQYYFSNRFESLDDQCIKLSYLLDAVRIALERTKKERDYNGRRKQKTTTS